MKIRPRLIETLLLILVFVSMPCLPWASGRSLFNGTPSPRLLFDADRVEVTTSETTIERDVPLRESVKDVFLLAVPPGELSFTIEHLSFRDLKTGELLDLDEIDDDTVRDTQLRGMERRVELDEYGWFRGLRVARLEVDHRRTFAFSSRTYEVASYTISVSYPEAEDVGAGNDGGLEEGALYREVLDEALLVPDMIDDFAQALGESPFEGPAEWQPVPEASPGFPWLKIPVSEDGLYAIDGLWMTEAGLDMNEIIPEDLYIIHEGEQVPVELAGPAGESFAGGRRLLFFARGSESPETTENTYYLGIRPDGVIPPAFRLGPKYDENLPLLTEYNRRRINEQDNERQTDFGAFLSIQSMSWIWGHLSEDEPLEAEFDLPGLALAETEFPTTFTIALYRQGNGSNPKLDLVAVIEDEEVATVSLQPRQMEYSFSLPTHRLGPKGNKISLFLRKPEDIARVNGGDDIYLDSLETVYTSLFVLEDGILTAEFTDPVSSPRGRFRLRVPAKRSAQLFALDITDPHQPVRLVIENAGMVKEVVADVALDTRILFTEADRVQRAPSPEASQWEDWKSTDKAADVLIVYHPLFQEAALLLEETIEEAGFRVESANVIAVYENFTWGRLSSDAIRRFLAFSVHEWQGGRPQAAILIGDSTSDGRNISGEDVPNYMPISTLVPKVGQESKSFSTDSIYTWLTGDDQAADMIIGRVSSSTSEEALAWVRNNIAYRQLNEGDVPWAGHVLAVSDTGTFQESLEEVVERSLAPGLASTMLAADEFAWEDNYYLPQHLITREEDSKVSPLLTAAIEEELDRGASIVTFFGHGAPNLWSNQRFWFGGGTPNSDILRLENGPRFPLVSSFTCNNAVVDYPLRPWNICIAEDFMRHEGKGAIGAFMPSGPGYLSNHEVIAEGFLRAWSFKGVRRMGPLTELARIYQHAKSSDDEHAWMFLFLGDPTLELPPAPDSDQESLVDSRLRETGGDLLIEEVSLLSEDGDDLRRQWAVLVRNHLNKENSGRLIATLEDAAGEELDNIDFDLTIGAREALQERVSFDLPDHGGYRIVFEIPHERGAHYVSRLPSRISEEFVVASQGDAGLRVAEGTVRMGGSSSRADSPALSFQIFNPGEEAVSGVLKGQVIGENEAEPLTIESRVPNVSAGGSSLFNESLSLPLEWKNPVTFELNLEFNVEESEPSGESYTWIISPEELPDLAVVADSISLSPQPLSDGLTVFMDVDIENRGTVRSPASKAALFLASDQEQSEPLRDITSDNYADVPILNPGEKTTIRLRWDPVDNAGRYGLKVVVDALDRIAEPDKSNNVATTPIRVRTKSKLKPGDLLVAKGEKPGELVLLAKVSNLGETPAHRVTVNFYKNDEQTDENKISEVLVERVPPGETVEAVYRWQIDLRKEDLTELKPTFTVALKGSQMRVSSVVEDAEKEGESP